MHAAAATVVVAAAAAVAGIRMFMHSLKLSNCRFMF